MPIYDLCNLNTETVLERIFIKNSSQRLLIKIRR
jgi:hypothetical protein